MNPYKAFTLCFLSVMLCLALQILVGPLERFTEALRMDCGIAPSTPPKYANDPERKPFSYRNKKP